MWQYVAINKHPVSGYRADQRGAMYDTIEELMDDMDFEVVEILEGEDLPYGLEDISARIVNCPDRLFAYRPNTKWWAYFGANVREE